jgi:RHS repeat-associated protein
MYGNRVQDMYYTYDNVGNITRIEDKSYTDNEKTTDYAYDDLYRLISASTTGAVNGQDYAQAYSYNAIGNITYISDVGSYSYDGHAGTSTANPHAATTIGSKTQNYDNSGNLTSDGTWTNTWDYRNRLIQSTKGTTTVRYGYDQNDDRVYYSVNGKATTTTVNMYYEITGATSTKYLYANNQLVATIEGTAIYYNHQDHLLGSNVISDSSGKMAELIDYYPYGSLRLDEKSSSFNEKKKFTGHEYDGETGLNYMMARYQNGVLGKFISIDPILSNLTPNEIYSNLYKEQYSKDLDFNSFVKTYGALDSKIGVKKDIKELSFTYFLSDPQQLNCYSYVTNNPIIGIDLTGKTEFHVSISTNAGMGGEAGNTWSFGMATNGSYGSSVSYHWGGLAGGNASLGVSIGYSNANSWQDTEGEGYYTGAGAKVALGPEVNVNLSKEGQYQGAEFSVGVGPSSPLYMHAGTGNTTILSQRNIKNDIKKVANTVKQQATKAANKVSNGISSLVKKIKSQN